MDYKLIQEDLEVHLKSHGISIQSLEFEDVYNDTIGTLKSSFDDNDLTLGQIKWKIEEFLDARGIIYEKIIIEL